MFNTCEQNIERILPPFCFRRNVETILGISCNGVEGGGGWKNRGDGDGGARIEREGVGDGYLEKGLLNGEHKITGFRKLTLCVELHQFCPLNPVDPEVLCDLNRFIMCFCCIILTLAVDTNTQYCTNKYNM